MGLLKSSKLDNGMVSFECIYGGLEAPFGGIDATKNPRYIDPRCFADASNFLLIDSELCLSGLASATLPSNGVTYPLANTSSNPGILLGVGKLPCQNCIKNWALYCSPAVNGSNNWNYRIVLWTQNTLGTNDTTAPETYDFPVYETNIAIPAVPAKTTITVNYTTPFTAIQSEAEHTLNLFPSGTQPTPYAYQMKLYEDSAFNIAITGAPVGYITSITDTLLTQFFSGKATPVSGAPPLPTPNDIATILASLITASDVPFNGSATGNVITLTVTTKTGLPSVDGNAGNLIGISGNMKLHDMVYYPLTAGLSPVGVVLPTFMPGQNDFVTPSFTITFSPVQGGQDATTIPNLPIQILSYDTIGDQIFFAGYPADYILQYNDSTKSFGYLTTYQGERVIKKFGGHLIGLGLINSPNNYETKNWLWFNWSDAQDLFQWSPVDPTTSLPTTAGGEQIPDISDLPTGLVVANSVAFILRAEGLSYVTELQSSTVPFEIAHVALAKDGQGCPSVSLWTQFDQVGFYVGNSNVFMLSQSPQAIGDKIWKQLFPQLQLMSNRLSDPPAPFTIVGAPPPYLDIYSAKCNVEALSFPQNNVENTQFGINLEGLVFMFDPSSGTWMKLNSDPILPDETNTPNMRWSILRCISLPRNSTMGYDGSYQNKESYLYGQQLQGANYQTPTLWQMVPYLGSGQTAYIWFPQEEISFGRDITIDALYVLAAGVPGLVVNFTVDGVIKNPSDGTFILTPGVFNGVLTFDTQANPNLLQEYQVFDTTGKAVTVKAPQLKATVPSQVMTYSPIGPYPITSTPLIRISKVAMFGSFDPEQRPV